MKRTLMWEHIASGLTGLALCALLGACCHWKDSGGADGGAVRLEPPDTRPVWSVEVADAAEAGLLTQELKLQPLRQEGATLYFYNAEGLPERLREMGYEPAQANPYDVYRRVVRVARRGSEEELQRYGVQLINREERHWVVEGPLASLRALARGGYRLDLISADEPRPREVRIRVRSRADVQRINGLHVDIFSVSDQVGTQSTTTEVHGAAFDHQIDKLRELGFEVTVIPAANDERREP